MNEALRIIDRLQQKTGMLPVMALDLAIKEVESIPVWERMLFPSLVLMRLRALRREIEKETL